ncbi:MAG: hypothetical protein IJG84_02640 [Kiritimatiellae bacterium]|nr:hypothetical protein [Kiritimatiellia bacterium]
MKCPFTGDTHCSCASYSPGIRGNPVLIILQEPGVAEKELGRPATGRTGANICRLFKKMKQHGCVSSTTNNNGFCFSNVSIINARTEDGQVIYQDMKYLDGISELKSKRIVLCFGEKAVRCFKTMYRMKYLSECEKLFCFPHIGTQGLSHINVPSKEADEDRESTVLREAARFIEKHLCGNACCFLSVQEFLRESKFKWRKGTLQYWATQEWVQKIFNCNYD